MRSRVLILPIAAVVITALCAYRLTREERRVSTAAGPLKRPAPSFALSNSESPPRPVRLSSYLGRHRMILVFFDGGLGADGDPRMLKMAQEAKQIENSDIKVFGISDALPPQNRAAIERLRARRLAVPFTLLTDLPPTEGAPRMGYLVHRQWGRYDERSGRPLPGIFLIDRAGRADWGENGPVPVEPDDPALEHFLAGH